MQFKGYKKIFVFGIFTFLCYVSTIAQPGDIGEIYFNINLKKYSVSAYVFIDTDSIDAYSNSKAKFTEFIPIKLYKYKDSNTVGVPYLNKYRKSSEESYVWNKLLVEIYDKKNSNNRMTIIIVGALNPEFQLIEIDIHFDEGLYLLDIPENQNNLKFGKRGWNLNPLLKKIH